METWILGLIGLALGPIRDLAKGAADRIASVYRSFTDALNRARGGFTYWADRGVSWAIGQARHMRAVASYLRYLVLVDLPRRAAGILDDAVRWVSDRLGALRDTLRAEYLSIRDWLVDGINAGRKALGDLQSWATARVADLVGAVNRLLSHVFGPLATPDRIVAWILAPLIGALVEWGMDNLERLTEQAWRRRTTIETRGLALTERILDRLL